MIRDNHVCPETTRRLSCNAAAARPRFNALLKRNDGFTYDFDKNGKQQNFCKICSEKRLQDARGLKDQAKGIPKYPPEKPSLRAKSRPTSDKANYAPGHSSRHGRIQTM